MRKLLKELAWWRNDPAARAILFGVATLLLLSSAARANRIEGRVEELWGWHEMRRLKVLSDDELIADAMRKDR